MVTLSATLGLSQRNGTALFTKSCVNLAKFTSEENQRRTMKARIKECERDVQLAAIRIRRFQNTPMKQETSLF